VRLGGQEFALLCPNFRLVQGLDFAENIRIKLAAIPFSNKHTGERMPPVTASFGVAQKRLNDGLMTV
jgi:diguanylate cyclase